MACHRESLPACQAQARASPPSWVASKIHGWSGRTSTPQHTAKQSTTAGRGSLATDQERTANVRAGTPVDVQVKVVSRAARVLAQVALGIRLVCTPDRMEE